MNQFLQKYRDLGYSFFNTGSALKKVRVPWAKYQSTKPTDQEIEIWSRYPSQNYAIVCGEISNLVVFDVDTKNDGDPTPFLNRGMYEVRTPSGGYHFYTTYDSFFKNTKHIKHEGILKAVDVQSNGSLVFCTPSAFANGKYTVTNDVPIGPLPDDLLAEILTRLEPETDNRDYTPYTGPQNPLDGRPGDVFNALASWEDVLYPLGWTKVGHAHSSGTQFWRRPGKKEGISASTNWKDYNLFFPYTTHYSELTIKKGYTKFHLLSALKYGGDFKEAAKALVMENYRQVNKIN